jgi:biotin carboxyl carrier protein
MTFEIEVNGRTRKVTVERSAPHRYRIAVDATVHLVDAVRVGNFGLSMLFDGESGVTREVQVAPGSVRGGGDPAAHAHGEQAVVAPMPGRVVRVLVSAGDEVAAKQGVVIVEAMKMENELRSPKAGRVKNVAVTPGMSVDMGRVLIVIE